MPYFSTSDMAISYRDLEEIVTGRDVVEYASSLASVAQRKKSPTVFSWCLDGTAALRFPITAVDTSSLPKVRAIDNIGANTAAFKSLNDTLKAIGSRQRIEVYRSKYLNNMVEQDHRNIKRRIRSMRGFKNFISAAVILDGIETAQMIRKGQLSKGCSSRSLLVLPSERGQIGLDFKLFESLRQNLLFATSLGGF